MPQLASPESLPQTASVPLMGRIAAGVPISAIQTRGHRGAAGSGGGRGAFRPGGEGRFHDRRRHQRGRHHHRQALRNAEQRRHRRGPGRKEEATLKRLRRGRSIALEAANPNYETRIFGPDQVASRAGWWASSAGIKSLTHRDYRRRGDHPRRRRHLDRGRKPGQPAETASEGHAPAPKASARASRQRSRS